MDSPIERARTDARLNSFNGHNTWYDALADVFQAGIDANDGEGALLRAAIEALAAEYLDEEDRKAAHKRCTT